FQGVRIAPTNAKWAFRVSIASLLTLGVAIFANWVVDAPTLAVTCFIAAQVGVAASIFIAVPGLVIPLGLLLAPFALAVYGVTHDWAVWTTWWFWGFTIVCAVLGGFALVLFGLKYGKPRL
ncbi:MAG TPA: hypothetical protein VGE76_05800, partial [Opitutaceae bacterium]